MNEVVQFNSLNQIDYIKNNIVIVLKKINDPILKENIRLYLSLFLYNKDKNNDKFLSLNYAVFLIRYIKSDEFDEKSMELFIIKKYELNSKLFEDFYRFIYLLIGTYDTKKLVQGFVSSIINNAEINDYFKKIYNHILGVIKILFINKQIDSSQRSFFLDYINNIVSNIVVDIPELSKSIGKSIDEIEKKSLHDKSDKESVYIFLEHIYGLSLEEMIKFIKKISSSGNINSGTINNKVIIHSHL